MSAKITANVANLNGEAVAHGHASERPQLVSSKLRNYHASAVPQIKSYPRQAVTALRLEEYFGGNAAINLQVYDGYGSSG